MHGLTGLKTTVEALKRVVDAEEWAAVKTLFSMLPEALKAHEDKLISDTVSLNELESNMEQCSDELGSAHRQIAELKAQLAAYAATNIPPGNPQANSGEAVPGSGDSVPV